ncbi:hypothetical protein INR49_001229, partial [Caranx melampygus]
MTQRLDFDPEEEVVTYVILELYFSSALSLQPDDMEVTALCFRLLMLGFLLLETHVHSLNDQQRGAASLRLTPDRLQFFIREAVSFHCEGTDGSAQFRKVQNATVSTPACDMERTSSGSSCFIPGLYPTDSGEYWCETDGGERSNSINITITDGLVILESPALPVMEGDDVTLRCRAKTTSTNPRAVFYKDNVPMNNSGAMEVTMKVSMSDEGLYRCSIQGAGESAESRLTVTAHNETVSDDSDSSKLHNLQWIIIIIVSAVALLLLLLLGFLHVSKHRVCSKTSRTSDS